jgi:hypothetical protein
MAFSAVDLSNAQAFRISPKDTNYFVMLFDKDSDKIDNIFVIEIFKTGGATPPNEHAAAHEFMCCMAKALPAATARRCRSRRVTHYCCIRAPST